MGHTLEVPPHGKARRVVAICPVLPYPALGGGHKRTLRLLEAIERAGGTPHVLTSDPDGDAGAAALRERGWGAELLREPPGTLRRRARQHAARLPSPYVPEIATRVRELVADGCAFVQVEQTQSAYYDHVFDGTPWVLSLHNVDSALLRSIARSERPLSRGWLSAWNSSRALRAVERRKVPAAEAVLCVSRDDRDALAKLGAEPLLVPNGVDDSFFDVPEAAPDDERVLFFGQFDYAPNASGIARFLADGWPRLAASRPAATLVLVGKGMSPALERAVARAERVEALGFVDDVERELARSRFTIAPLWEGGGTRLKVVESLAAARTVVGTPLGVEGMGFEHGRHGMVADSPAALAEAAASLLADPGVASRLASEGRRLAESFRWSEATRPAIALYERLLQNH
jgi:glycosyltransferase involved in cell wall biosynthesis